MIPNIFPNFQPNNNFNPFNNFINFGFGPNPNANIPGLIMDGASSQGWKQLYNTKNRKETGFNQFPGKINAILRTTKGMKLNIYINFDKTVSELINIYFKRVEKPYLFNRPQDICFIYNASRINFNEQKTVEQYFQSFNVNILVNDVKDLIGA